MLCAASRAGAAAGRDVCFGSSPASVQAGGGAVRLSTIKRQPTPYLLLHQPPLSHGHSEAPDCRVCNFRNKKWAATGCPRLPFAFLVSRPQANRRCRRRRLRRSRPLRPHRRRRRRRQRCGVETARDCFAVCRARLLRRRLRCAQGAPLRAEGARGTVSTGRRCGRPAGGRE